MNMIELKYVPKSGTASDVAGIVSATIFKNTVSESKIVTPAELSEKECRKMIFNKIRIDNENWLLKTYPTIIFLPNLEVMQNLITPLMQSTHTEQLNWKNNKVCDVEF